jgi:hypothetical protein
MVIGVVSGDVLEETVAAGAGREGHYWRIDYTKEPAEAVLINEAGEKRSGPKTVEPTQHGGFRLVEPKNNNQVIVEYIPWWAEQPGSVDPGPATELTLGI